MNRTPTSLFVLPLLSIFSLALAQQPTPTAPPAAPPAAPTPLTAQEQMLLSDQRWRDTSYGLSLLPPLGTQLVQQTADEALLRIVDDANTYAITLLVKRTRSPMNVKQAAELAAQQVSQAQGTTMPLRIGADDTSPLDLRSDVLAGLPAEVFYVRVPVGNGREVMHGQAVAQIDRTLFAFLDVKCDIKDRPQVRRIFEAVLRSLELSDLKALDRQRQQALEAGQKWRQSVTLKQLHAALIPEQYFRLLEAGRDIGYMRMSQTRGKHENKDGINVEVQSRFVLEVGTIDSLAQYFLPDDDSGETWMVKTTQRAPGAGGAQPSGQSLTFVETGMRVGDKISVTIDGPTGRKKQEYDVPKLGYLSQVETWLLPAVLPIERPGTYGFYAYHSNQGKLLMRTEQVVPLLGGFNLTTQLAPNEPSITASYDSSRKLVSKQLPGKRTLQPTTAAMIQQLWRGR